jgi:hypothetical protein
LPGNIPKCLKSTKIISLLSSGQGFVREALDFLFGTFLSGSPTGIRVSKYETVFFNASVNVTGASWACSKTVFAKMPKPRHKTGAFFLPSKKRLFTRSRRVKPAETGKT